MSRFRKTTILFLLAFVNNQIYSSSIDNKESTVEIRRATKAPTAEAKFDQIVSRYVSKIREAKQKSRNNLFYSPAIIEQFDTSAGTISISSRDFRFGVLRSKKAAWIRIGKDQSSDNVEAIQLFLKNSRQEKINAGFSMVDKKEWPSDYGKTYVTKLVRGDQYFTTYFQTIRILGTYDRFSMAYTYYIEMGLISRKKNWETEQAEEKLGL